MRTYTQATRREQPAASRSWLQAALYLPVGYAATQVVGEGTAVLLVVLFVGVVAGVHLLLPSMVELLAGAGGLVAGVFAATDDGGCGDVLGSGGNVVVMAYGGIVSASAFLALLGSASGRAMARHLLVATAALPISLLVVSPVGRSLVSPDDDVTIAIVLAAALLAVTVFGVRSRHGVPVLGLGVLTAQAVLALSGGPCAVSPGTAVVGSVAFTAVALVLHRFGWWDEPAAHGGTHGRAPGAA